MIKVKNLPGAWRDYPWLIVTRIEEDGQVEHWHYGCYRSMEKALDIVDELNRVCAYGSKVAVPSSEIEEA